VPYLVVVVGSLRPGPLRRLLLAGDVSYGVYIYSFPLQQTLVQYLGGITPLELLALSAPLSWLAGAASWRLIERRALALKRVLIRPRPAERSPDPLVAASARASS
jgi:peptidoglycan/LPS O-acetylase OafA/YrhL